MGHDDCQEIACMITRMTAACSGCIMHALTVHVYQVNISLGTRRM